MSPIPDPRFSKTRRAETLRKEREAGDLAARMEYIKPLVMLVIGGTAVMGVRFFSAGAGAALLYPVALSIELVFGVAGLWLAAKLWLGGAGPLALAILRLAGIYAATDLIASLVSPWMFLGWAIHIACYLGLLTWLFELDLADSIMLAVITFLLKVLGAFTIGFLLAGVI